MSEAPPLSPCIAVCVLDPKSGYCRGCFRTIDEIAGWVTLAGDEKRRILALLPLRRQQKASETEA
jgi:uncharacterized protein